MSEIRRKELASWCLFDFANSTYSAVIAAVVFPVYYTSVIVGNDTGAGDLWWGRAISMSMLVVALCSPLLGGIADYSGMRKRFLIVFTYVSIAAIAALSLLDKGMALQGFFLIVLANIGMEGGLVFYNSYLTDIVPPQYQGRASSWGFGVGYAGSMVSLVIVLPMVKAGQYGLSWLSVSLLFAVFSAPAFLYLPQDKASGNMAASAKRSLSFTLRTLRELFARTDARRFLFSYLLFADGVNTVIVFSSIYAATTLKFAAAELVMLYILVQAAALTGAFAMARRVDYLGPKKVVIFSLMLWTLVCVMAYFVTGKTAFWCIALTAGLALGTVQAASRALYAQLIPKGHESEYFGVYALAGKSSAVIGPLVFGYISLAMGSQRPAILSIAFFFIAGLGFLLPVRAGGPNAAKDS